MRFYFYRGVSKIDSLYNECVERTETEITQTTSKKAHGKAHAKWRITLGELLHALHLGKLDGEVGSELGAQLANSKAVVSQLMPEQKLRVVEARAHQDQGTLQFDQAFNQAASSKKSRFITVELPMHLDVTASPPEKVEKGMTPVFLGEHHGIKVLVRASVQCMDTPGTWMRFLLHAQPVGLFGKLTYADEEGREAEVQPVVMYWA